MINFESDKDFSTVIMNKLLKRLSEKEYDIQLIDMVDTDGVETCGLQIYSRKIEREVNRVIVMKAMHDLYKQGNSLDAVVSSIIESIVDSDRVQLALSKVNIRSYEEIRKYLVFAVMGDQKYKSLSMKLPHIKFLDMVVYFSVEISVDSDYRTYTSVTDSLLKEWGVNLETVIQDAIVNTPKRFPPVVTLLDAGVDEESIDNEILEVFDATEVQLSDRDMYLVTNKENIGGAAVILYPNFLKELADCIEDDLIILPASVNELIVMGRSTFISDNFADSFRELVAEMNSTSAEDMLTNSVYTYLRKEEHFDILKS